MILLTNAAFLERFDFRLVGQNLSDSNIPYTYADLTTGSAVQKLADIIDDAQGMVISALYTAYKYTADDLAALDTDSTSILQRIIADIAFIYVASRRGFDYKSKMPLVEDSYEQLQRLRNGERVLNIPGNETSGLTQNDTLGGSFITQAQAGLVSTVTRYFPEPIFTQNRF
jgi:hypothetical protein